MALLLKDNLYLKVDLDGNYVIYKNRSARNKEKRATSPQEVIAKYIEMMDKYDATINEEQYYYDPDSFIANHNAWTEEANSYSEHLATYDTTGDYPLMQQYIPDINNTIPAIVETGHMGMPKVDTLEEMYQNIKEFKIFGEIDEVKDA